MTAREYNWISMSTIALLLSACATPQPNVTGTAGTELRVTEFTAPEPALTEGEERVLRETLSAKYAAIASGDFTSYAARFDKGVWPTSDFQLFDDDPIALDRAYTELAVAGGNSEVSGDFTVLTVARDGQFTAVSFVETTYRWDSNPFVPAPDATHAVNVRNAVLDTARGVFVRYDLMDSTDEEVQTGGEDDFQPTWNFAEVAISEDPRAFPGDVDSPPPPPSYTGAAAASYADTYATSYNSSYRSFSPTDCANFGSQALYAGGRAMGWGLYTSTKNWWYSSLNQTYTWTSANYLYNNLRSYTSSTQPTTINGIAVGDLIFADWESDGTKDHTMIVSEKLCSSNSWSCVTVDYHSNDKYRNSMSTVAASVVGESFYSVHPIF